MLDEVTELKERIRVLQTLVDNLEAEKKKLREAAARMVTPWQTTKDLGKRARYVVMVDSDTMLAVQTETGQRPMFRSEVGQAILALRREEDAIICRVVPVKKVKVSPYRRDTRDGMIWRYLHRKYLSKQQQTVDMCDASDVS